MQQCETLRNVVVPAAAQIILRTAHQMHYAKSELALQICISDAWQRTTIAQHKQLYKRYN
jgi:hypothetical protein